MLQLRAKTKSFTFPPLSIARYSFIQLSQPKGQWRERKCPIFETVAKGDSNPGSLDCESGILPVSYRAPLNRFVLITWSIGIATIVRAHTLLCAFSHSCCAQNVFVSWKIIMIFSNSFFKIRLKMRYVLTKNAGMQDGRENAKFTTRWRDG